MSEDLLDGFISEKTAQTTTEPKPEQLINEQTSTEQPVNEQQPETAYEKAVKLEESLEDEFTRLLKEFIAESEKKSAPAKAKKNNNQPKSIEGILEQEGIKSGINLDDFVSPEKETSTSLDGFVTNEAPKGVSLDSFVTNEAPKSASLDSFITNEAPKSASLDSFITPNQEEPQGLDGFITNETEGSSQSQGMFKNVSPIYTEKLSPKQATLKPEELELSRAIANFQDGMKAISKKKNLVLPTTDYTEDMLIPNYKPSVGKKIANYLLSCWDILNKYDPENMQRLPKNANDEQFLVFAESLKDVDMQLVIISYVEILINLEICEVKYEQKKEIITKNRIKKELYEEYIRLQERKNLFIKKLKEQNFPIDVDRLMNNYFRAAQKDTKGAFDALTKNPAMFAPIEFEKIKPRFFGLIKVTPEDGIKMNQKIGEFIKKLKV